MAGPVSWVFLAASKFFGIVVLVFQHLSEYLEHQGEPSLIVVAVIILGSSYFWSALSTIFGGLRNFVLGFRVFD